MSCSAPTAPRLRRVAATSALLLGALFAPATASAQSAGTTGASVLDLPAGSRATGFAGAYAAMAGDIDAIFYNPAGIGTLNSAVGLSYQSYVAGVTIGSAAGAFRIGHVVVGAAVNYLDGGSIDVLEPDPSYGGQRGRLTGQTATAGETAIKLSIAGSLVSPRFHIGTSAGYVSSTIAGYGRGAPFFDLGAEFRISNRLGIGASVRNFGGSLRGSGTNTVDAPLPTESRIGVSGRMPLTGELGVIADLDLASRVQGQGTSLLGGLEFGLEPHAGRPFSAVGRIGYATGSRGSLGGNLRLGAGIGIGNFAVDYTYETLDFFGAIHRFGIRWTRP